MTVFHAQKTTLPSAKVDLGKLANAKLHSPNANRLHGIMKVARTPLTSAPLEIPELRCQRMELLPSILMAHTPLKEIFYKIRFLLQSHATYKLLTLESGQLE